MPDKYSREDYLDTQRKRVVEIASNILEKKLDIIEGTRLLLPVGHEIPELNNNPDFLTLIGIDSETDHLPIGKTRKLWAQAALDKADLEINAAEKSYAENAFASCRQLIKLFT